MNHFKNYAWLYILIFALIMAIAIRIILPWNTVFTPNGVVFGGVDCYYYLHLADLISHNNLQIPQFDAYYDFPNGLDYSSLPSSYNAYGFFIALLAWICTFGHTTKESLDFVGALHPAILGILSLIPIFIVVNKLVRNKIVASFSVLLGAIMPGEFLARSILGACDTHCLEIFLFGYIIMFTVLAFNANKLKYAFATLSGLLSFLYLLMWQGAIIYPLILCAFGIIQIIVNRLRNQNNYTQLPVIWNILGVSALLYLLFSNANFMGALLLFVPLCGLFLVYIYTRLTSKWNKWAYLIPMVIVAVVLLAMMASIKFVGFGFYPSWFTNIARQAWNIIAWHTQSTTSEELPLLITLGTVTPDVPYLYFGVCWYIFFIGFGYLLYKYIKHNNINVLFVLVWSLVMLIPTLAMRRFAYYFAFNVIIVSVYMLWQAFRYWVMTTSEETTND